MPADKVCYRAYTSIANLGWGLDVLALAVGVGSDSVTAQRTAETGVTLEIMGPYAEGVPADADKNTAGRAVQALFEAAGQTAGVLLSIGKGTRRGSGLGSSAASAAAAVAAVNDLMGLGLCPNELIRYAAIGETASAGARHADNVAAALMGGFVVVDPDEPTRTRDVATAAPPTIVVALPSIHADTKSQRAALPKQIELATYVSGVGRVAAIVAAWSAGDHAALGRAIEDSFVDRARAGAIPGFDAVREAAHAAGALGLAISGSGPACFAICPDADVAQHVEAAISGAFDAQDVVSQVTAAHVAPGAHRVERDA